MKFLQQVFESTRHHIIITEQEWNLFEQTIQDLDFRQLSELTRKAAMAPITELRQRFTIEQIKKKFTGPIPVELHHLQAAANELASSYNEQSTSSPKYIESARPIKPKQLRAQENDDDDMSCASHSSARRSSASAGTSSNTISCPLCAKEIGLRSNGYNLAKHLVCAHQGVMAPALDVLAQTVLNLIEGKNKKL